MSNALKLLKITHNDINTDFRKQNMKFTNTKWCLVKANALAFVT